MDAKSTFAAAGRSEESPLHATRTASLSHALVASKESAMSAAHLHTRSAVLQLPQGQPLRMTRGSGTRVHAATGSLWITIDGDAQDHVLAQGESLLIESAQPVLITALGGRASVAVCSTQAARAAGLRSWATPWTRGLVLAG
jgi:hypothetical protein